MTPKQRLKNAEIDEKLKDDEILEDLAVSFLIIYLMKFTLSQQPCHIYYFIHYKLFFSLMLFHCLLIATFWPFTFYILANKLLKLI